MHACCMHWCDLCCIMYMRCVIHQALHQVRVAWIMMHDASCVMNVWCLIHEAWCMIQHVWCMMSEGFLKSDACWEYVKYATCAWWLMHDVRALYQMQDTNYMLQDAICLDASCMYMMQYVWCNMQYEWHMMNVAWSMTMLHVHDIWCLTPLNVHAARCKGVMCCVVHYVWCMLHAWHYD